LIAIIPSQRPEHPHPRDIIQLPAISEPHQGTSYNPPVEAHTELILKASEVEEKRAKEADRMMEVKNRIGKAVVGKAAWEESGAEGMIVDEGADGAADPEGVEGDVETPIVKKIPERKTKQQKAKAARLRAEVRHFIPHSPFPILTPPPNRNVPFSKNLTKSV
jgi:nucleolar protein 53